MVLTVARVSWPGQAGLAPKDGEAPVLCAPLLAAVLCKPHRALTRACRLLGHGLWVCRVSLG